MSNTITRTDAEVIDDLRTQLEAAEAAQTRLREALQAVVESMRTIQMVAGQCSVEGPEDAKALMAAAESERCRGWADVIEAALTPKGPSE